MYTYIRAVGKQALTRYTRKGYAHIGVSQSQEVVFQTSFADYLDVNLIRILNTQFLSRNVLQSVPHSHWRLVSAMNKHWAQSGIYRYASAKVQIKLEIKKNLARKIIWQQKKSQNIWNFKEYIVSLQRERNLFRMGAPVGSASTH